MEDKKNMDELYSENEKIRKLTLDNFLLESKLIQQTIENEKLKKKVLDLELLNNLEGSEYLIKQASDFIIIFIKWKKPLN